MPRRRRRFQDPLAPWPYPRLQREATFRARETMGVERRAIEAERQRIARRNEASRIAIQASGDAVTKLLGEAAARAETPYREAAGFLGGIAGLANRGMGERLGSSPDPMHAVDIQGQQEVMRTMGATNPGERLLTLGAQARTQADLQPGIAGKATQEALIAALKRAGMEDDEFGQRLLEQAAKYPELRAQILDQLTKFEMDKRGQRLYERQFGLKQQEFAEEKRQNRLTYNLQVQKYQLDLQEAAAEGRQPSASLSKTYGYIVDQDGNPILDANGKRIPVAKTGKGAGAKSTDYRDAVKDARTMRGSPIKDTDDVGEGIYLARPGAKGAYPDGTTNDPKKARYENDMTFAEALDYIMATYGLTRKRARSALISAGWKPDGKRPKKKGK